MRPARSLLQNINELGHYQEPYPELLLYLCSSLEPETVEDTDSRTPFPSGEDPQCAEYPAVYLVNLY